MYKLIFSKRIYTFGRNNLQQNPNVPVFSNLIDFLIISIKIIHQRFLIFIRNHQVATGKFLIIYV